jgi:hypothetical protein
MIFLNISSDYVQLFSEWKIQNLERNGIENILWKVLLDEKKKSDFKSIFLLNWPGWFTNLRVGTLCLNTLDTLFSNQIKIYNTSKISLYKFLFDHKFLPRIGYIYIWQKNNCRKYDFQTEKYETITKAEIQYEWNYFLDFVYEDAYRQDTENMLRFNLIGEDIQTNFLDKNESVSIEELSLKPQYQVAPDYMIDAVKY